MSKDKVEGIVAPEDAQIDRSFKFTALCNIKTVRDILNTCRLKADNLLDSEVAMGDGYPFDTMSEYIRAVTVDLTSARDGVKVQEYDNLTLAMFSMNVGTVISNSIASFVVWRVHEVIGPGWDGDLAKWIEDIKEGDTVNMVMGDLFRSIDHIIHGITWLSTNFNEDDSAERGLTMMIDGLNKAQESVQTIVAFQNQVIKQNGITADSKTTDDLTSSALMMDGLIPPEAVAEVEEMFPGKKSDYDVEVDPGDSPQDILSKTMDMLPDIGEVVGEALSSLND